MPSALRGWSWQTDIMLGCLPGSFGTLLFLSFITAPRSGHCVFTGEEVHVQKPVNTSEVPAGYAGLYEVPYVRPCSLAECRPLTSTVLTPEIRTLTFRKGSMLPMIPSLAIFSNEN